MPDIQFPNFVIQQFGAEQAPIEIESEEQNEFAQLYAFEQYFDSISAYEYVKNFFASRDLSALTGEDMVELVKAIHQKAADALIQLTGGKAGEYTHQRIMIFQETGLAEMKQEGPSTFSAISEEHNFNILKTKYGADKAQLYLDFTEALKAKMQSRTDQELDVCQEAQGLSEHSGYELFMETVQFGKSPLEIPQLMEEYAADLVRRLTNNFPANAQETAAFALYRLCEIHPFENGNGRVGRILMNTILVLAGQNAICAESRKKELCQAFKKSTENNLEPLIQFIDEVQRQEYTSEKLEPLTDVAKWPFCFKVRGVSMVCFKKIGHYVLVQANLLILYNNFMGNPDGCLEDGIKQAMLGIFKEETKQNIIEESSTKGEMAQAFVEKTITAEVLRERAERAKRAQPMIARYYYWRAADFYREMDEPTQQQEMLGEVAKMTEILQRQADQTQQYQSLLAEVRNQNSQGATFYKQRPEPQFELALKCFENAKKIVVGLELNCHDLSDEQIKEIASEKAIILCNIGSCHRELRDYDSAATNFKKAYTIRKETLGEENPSTQKAFKKWKDIIKEQISAKSLPLPSC